MLTKALLMKNQLPFLTFLFIVFSIVYHFFKLLFQIHLPMVFKWCTGATFADLYKLNKLWTKNGAATDI